MTPTKKSDLSTPFPTWNSHRICGIRRKCADFTENAWNSPSSVDFAKRRGIHGKDAEFTEMAWNSRYGMEPAGVVLVMWGVAHTQRRPTENFLEDLRLSGPLELAGASQFGLCRQLRQRPRR